MDKFKVMVVDDEVDYLENIVKKLHSRKIDVTGVQSGYQALEFLDNNSPDVIVLDVVMPGMDGIETLREIKKKKPLTEVIMLTGEATVELAIKAMRSGAFDYVLKPVALDALLDKLRNAHERKEIQEKKIR